MNSLSNKENLCEIMLQGPLNPLETPCHKLLINMG